MPLSKGIHKVMVIGSGPIVIGQAAEFDYAGTQACRALKEEGLEVVLTGRDPAPAFLSIADYVSEVRKQKHPFDNGISARLGIEY